uniref:Peptidase S54 rhomboid domain-containing protein n=1 Tax=Labrus bergylta TaxID=56723 RepID=A0A3Q3E4Z4_9LABR
MTQSLLLFFFFFFFFFFTDVFLYAFSHDEPSSLLVSVALLLLFGPCQERRWGSVAFLALSVLTLATLPLLYTLVLFVGGAEASRICGYSAIQLALFTVQCRQVTQRRLLRCLPVWFLPWLFCCSVCCCCRGRPPCFTSAPYAQITDALYLTEVLICFVFHPNIFTLSSPHPSKGKISSLLTLTCRSSIRRPVDQAAAPPPVRDPSFFNYHPQEHPIPAWLTPESAAQSEAAMLEEQMLRAGILASLQDAPDDPDAKVEVPKSSVSSLRLQQLEKMGFPTEKAVVALAASKQLDGAISLLIDDSVGEQAVMVSKGKSPVSPQGT